MGWERRGNRQHFYTACRVGGRVIKEYVADAVAPFASRLAAEQRAERDAARAAEHRSRANAQAETPTAPRRNTVTNTP